MNGTKRYLLVPVVLAVLAVCTVGVAYAIYSDVVDEDNDMDVRYNILTPQGVTTDAPWFNKSVRYNTHIEITQAGRVITYSLDPTQMTEITVSSNDHEVILLGEVVFKVEQVGGSEDYDFIMTDTAGTMTGTFYTAVATSEDNDTYSAWEYKAYVNNTGVTYAGIDPDDQYVKLRFYVDTSWQPDGSALQPMPMDGVTFSFSVETDE